MLRLRVASGLVLAAAMIAAIVYLPTPWLAAFLLLLCLLAAREWAKLAGIVTRAGWLVYAIAVSGSVAALWVASEDSSPVVKAVPIGATVFWILALGLVLTYPRSRIVLLSKPVMIAAGVVALPGAWLALVQTAKAPEGPGLLIWLLAAAAAADIGAYFAGRRFGRRKLAPQVSPGKTWEGAIGGAVAILAWGIVGAMFFGAEQSLPRWLVLVAALFVASVTGDLFESAFKRARGVKDSGGLLPGHGGVLDRVDSVIAAAPVFAVLAPVLLASY
ncbi:MAG: phosphatidate cytidylyltransferase [Gammaproteobacteria bacterium]|nr:phosphatidate cytidylyltransferase [Gammaproteobacteria bacterium]